MYHLDNSTPLKIKRRNFFLYLGTSVLGLFAFSITPLNVFRSKTKKLAAKKTRMHVSPNPDSVKREAIA